MYLQLYYIASFHNNDNIYRMWNLIEFISDILKESHLISNTIRNLKFAHWASKVELVKISKIKKKTLLYS